jgi:flagellar basal body-associated protein FliL
MSDEEKVDESVTSNTKARGGLSNSNFVVKLLVILASAIGAIIFIVAVASVTVMLMQSKSAITALSPSPTFETNINYEYATPLDIRGRTSDETPRTYQVSVVLGYLTGDRKTIAEIAKRKSQLQDIMRSFFSAKTSAQLAPEHQSALKMELKEQVNYIFSEGQVKDVLFPEFLVD